MGHPFTLICKYRYIWNKTTFYIQAALIKPDLFNNPLTYDIN